METNQVNITFKRADQQLAAAKNELNRPAEDVVPFMVCQSARQSISLYLQGFLLKHGIETADELSTEVLLEKSLKIDSTFKGFDLSAITFSKDDEYSALSQEMENCVDLAKKAKQLAIQ